jgi:signal transduction histidine kinase
MRSCRVSTISLSHELKTPLTAAREFVSIVLTGWLAPERDAARDLGVVRTAAIRSPWA